MRPAANSRLHRRSAFWVLLAVCLALVAVVPWSVARAVRLLNGPSVLLPGDGYGAVAVTPDGRTLYAANFGEEGHTVTPVDVATGDAGKPIAVGPEPQELVITPNGQALFALLSDGRITPVDLAAGRAMPPIHITGLAYSLAVSPNSKTLYVGTNVTDSIVPVDIASRHQGTPIPLPASTSGSVAPDAMAVTPDGRTLYVAESDNTVIPVTLATGSARIPIDVGTADTMPTALALSPDGETLYVAVDGNYDDGILPSSLVAVNTATDTVSRTIAYSPGPIGLIDAPSGRTLYVLNSGGDFVTDESTVIPVSTADGRTGKPIRTGGLFSQAGAFSFAITPDGRTAYVAQGDVVAIGLLRLASPAPRRSRLPPARGPSADGYATRWFTEFYDESRHWPEVPATFKSWPEYEDKATSLRVWSPSIIHGLLQTPAYARALIAVQPHITQQTADERLAGRMERQQRVIGRGIPPTAWFIIDELSLYRQVGTTQDMAAQLRHILQVAAMPKITVQVLPPIAHPVNASGFLLADDAAWVEHAAAGFVYTEQEITSALALRFDTLRGECYRVSESAALLERLEILWKAGASPLTPTATAGTA